MSVVQDAWTQFKTQVQADTTLSAYITTFRFTRQEYQFSQNLFPIFVAFPISIVESVEGWVGVPKQKIVNLVVQVSAKVMKSDGEALETEILKADELAKNAVEANLQLTNKATIADVSDSSPAFLEKNVGDTTFTINIKVPRFTAGSR